MVPCNDCGGPLSYVEQYNRYFCWNCHKYAPENIVNKPEIETEEEEEELEDENLLFTRQDISEIIEDLYKRNYTTVDIFRRLEKMGIRNEDNTIISLHQVGGHIGYLRAIENKAKAIKEASQRNLRKARAAKKRKTFKKRPSPQNKGKHRHKYPFNQTIIIQQPSAQPEIKEQKPIQYPISTRELILLLKDLQTKGYTLAMMYAHLKHTGYVHISDNTEINITEINMRINEIPIGEEVVEEEEPTTMEEVKDETYDEKEPYKSGEPKHTPEQWAQAKKDIIKKADDNGFITPKQVKEILKKNMPKLSELTIESNYHSKIMRELAIEDRSFRRTGKRSQNVKWIYEKKPSIFKIDKKLYEKAKQKIKREGEAKLTLYSKDIRKIVQETIPDMPFKILNRDYPFKIMKDIMLRDDCWRREGSGHKTRYIYDREKAEKYMHDAIHKVSKG